LTRLLTREQTSTSTSTSSTTTPCVGYGCTKPTVKIPFRGNCFFADSRLQTTPTPTTSKSVSLCTSTVVSTPTPTCEYQCGKWCSNPLPPFSDHGSCSTSAANCAVQVFSCYMNAGWSAYEECSAFSDWCSSVSSYCSSSCPGSNCNLKGCKSKWPPVGPPPPATTYSPTVYPCTQTTTLSKSTTSYKPTTTSSVPIPTQSCICSQPNNPSKGYSSTSPVGSISLPCLTCNNIYSDYSFGNHFKLYTSSDSKSCSSYPSGSVPQGCKDSCDYQKNVCLNTYAESCKGNSAKDIAGGKDSYTSACNKCASQWSDCYAANGQVSGGNRCTGWNLGWY
jgi:hypothetical protein